MTGTDANNNSSERGLFEIRMKKAILLSVMLLMVMGFAFAVPGPNDNSLDGVHFTEPVDYWYSGEVPVEWTNEQPIDDLYLRYSEDCDNNWDNILLSDIDPTQLTYNWEVSELDEGEYCLRLGASDEFAYSYPICVDHTEPNVAVCADCCWSEGNESDTHHWNDDTGTTVRVNYEDELVCGELHQCVLSCTIDWGDGTESNCLDVCGNDDKKGWSGFDDDEYHHQYRDSGEYDVTVTVEDCSGNVGVAEDTVEVENVVPECEIEAPTDAAVGQPVNFAGYITNFPGEEVEADMETMTYSWDMDEASTSLSGDEVTYTYTEAGLHHVVLTVDDGDEGMNTCQHTIDVVDPTPLTDQEVAAYYNLEADFSADGGVGNKFPHNVSFEYCQKVAGPENLMILNDGPGNCMVVWNNERPTNDEQGTHEVVVRVGNWQGDYEYYSFDVTVWSWIIDLNEGWNFVSIPYVPADNSIDAVILDQLYDVLPGSTEYVVLSYQYTGEGSEWLKSRRSGVGDLDTVSPGYGYWIKVTQDTQLKGNGMQLSETPGLPPEVEIPTNHWAMIGRYGIIGQYAPTMTCGNPLHGAIPKSVALDSVLPLGVPANQISAYSIDESNHLDTVENLMNNEAYLIWVQSAGEVAEYAPLDKAYTEEYYGCGPVDFTVI